MTRQRPESSVYADGGIGGEKKKSLDCPIISRLTFDKYRIRFMTLTTVTAVMILRKSFDEPETTVDR